MNTQIPKARKNQLVIQEMPNEVLLYDLDINKAYCLNKTAVFVWKSCDGTNSVEDITRLAQKEFASPVNEDLIWLAIDQLNSNDLLEKKMSMTPVQNRREMIKKIGLGTMVALPVITSLVAPTSALASASCACVVPGDCPAQTTCPSTVNCNPSGVCAP